MMAAKTIHPVQPLLSVRRVVGLVGRGCCCVVVGGMSDVLIVGSPYRRVPGWIASSRSGWACCGRVGVEWGPGALASGTSHQLPAPGDGGGPVGDVENCGE